MTVAVNARMFVVAPRVIVYTLCSTITQETADCDVTARTTSLSRTPLIVVAKLVKPPSGTRP